MNLRIAAHPTQPPPYMETIGLIECLHQHVLDTIKGELERVGDNSLTPAQAFLLYSIGDQELKANQLRARGCYYGTNVSYNLQKLVRMGMLRSDADRNDRRAVKITLTEKGRAVQDIFKRLFDRHLRAVHGITGVSPPDFELTNKCLRQIDMFLRGTIY